ncbi:nitroreductase family protein [Streptomyces sp. NPDC005438]|uniref:Acg family FMN-binding oxidoreductase n=1 Tax=Streptomyces sp. NPDC005438 TaxID=3156880 RepID=UPI00339ED625
MDLDTLPRTLVASLVEDAVTAPSMHNAQPWRFVHRADTGTLELYGDPARALPSGDPDRRALHLGCGACLFSLRVAAAHAGLRAEVHLLPDPTDPWHLARIHLGPALGPDPELAQLRWALRRRHTNRFPFSEKRVPTPVLEGLRQAAVEEGCRLALPDAWHADFVLDLVHDSRLFEAVDEAMREEIRRWTRTQDRREEAATEGIPAYALGPRQEGVSTPVRDFDPGRRMADRQVVPFERHPQLALLGTVRDTAADWLTAGQAMQRVLLRATLDGLATSLMTQPLEWPELRPIVRDPGSDSGFVQMIIRFGYGPPTPATPRRPVSEVLDFT